MMVQIGSEIVAVKIQLFVYAQLQIPVAQRWYQFLKMILHAAAYLRDGV